MKYHLNVHVQIVWREVGRVTHWGHWRRNQEVKSHTGRLQQIPKFTITCDMWNVTMRCEIYMAGLSICLKHCAKRGKKTRPRVDQKMRPQSYPEIPRVNRSHTESLRVAQSYSDLELLRVTQSYPVYKSYSELPRLALELVVVVALAVVVVVVSYFPGWFSAQKYS